MQIIIETPPLDSITDFYDNQKLLRGAIMSEQEDMFDDRPLEDPGPFPYGEDDGEDQDDLSAKEGEENG